MCKRPSCGLRFRRNGRCSNAQKLAARRDARPQRFKVLRRPKTAPEQGSGTNFNSSERIRINEIGYESGCHRCCALDPGTKSGNYIPDHQPVSQLNSSNLPQRLYPHCLSYSRKQGGVISQIKQVENRIIILE